jgi:hypothetical protein
MSDKWLEQKVTYAGIKQRWLIVESAERKQSDIQKLNLKPTFRSSYCIIRGYKTISI